MTELAGKPLGLVYDMATDSAGTTVAGDVVGMGSSAWTASAMNTDSGDET